MHFGLGVGRLKLSQICLPTDEEEKKREHIGEIETRSGDYWKPFLLGFRTFPRPTLISRVFAFLSVLHCDTHYIFDQVGRRHHSFVKEDFFDFQKSKTACTLNEVDLTTTFFFLICSFSPSSTLSQLFLSPLGLSLILCYHVSFIFPPFSLSLFPPLEFTAMR